jgi:hypothetical protein
MNPFMSLPQHRRLPVAATVLLAATIGLLRWKGVLVRPAAHAHTLEALKEAA